MSGYLENEELKVPSVKRCQELVRKLSGYLTSRRNYGFLPWEPQERLAERYQVGSSFPGCARPISSCPQAVWVRIWASRMDRTLPGSWPPFSRVTLIPPCSLTYETERRHWLALLRAGRDHDREKTKDTNYRLASDSTASSAVLSDEEEAYQTIRS